MKSSSLIQKLRSVQVQIAERREDETALGSLYDVWQVLSIVGSEVNNESVLVDF